MTGLKNIFLFLLVVVNYLMMMMIKSWQYSISNCLIFANISQMEKIFFSLFIVFNPSNEKYRKNGWKFSDEPTNQQYLITLNRWSIFNRWNFFCLFRLQIIIILKHLRVLFFSFVDDHNGHFHHDDRWLFF